jgi:serine/threonine-protein kinase
MNPGRLREAEEIFHEALQRDPAERDAFVRRACRDDSGLRREVASLLANHSADPHSESWAAAAAAQLVNSSTSLQPGQSLGPYRIESFIAAGGMGEVYRATDTRLNRAVAIKVCAERFSERFAQEARVIASLNHPHICHLYDVGPNYLVMELVEGTPLRGPLPLKQTLDFAGQILDALDAAHRKGITHRDLKPANILVTKQGIKLLDFGLAKRSAPLQDSDATLTATLTGKGEILGTLQYMSPEQLQGKEADVRSDLFSFGCVLYEMLSGKRAFDGKSAASVIAAVLEREPEQLKAAPPLERVVKRALAKDPEQRFQTARDLKAALSWALEHVPALVGVPKSRWRIAVATAAALAVALAAVLWIAWRDTRSVDHALIRLTVDGAERSMGMLAVAISPDGRRLVMQTGGSSAARQLATRTLDQREFVPLPGTESGREPFFSSDGQWIGFFALGHLAKISVKGGAPITLSSTGGFGPGATWAPDGSIIAAPNMGSGLVRVPGAGAEPQPLTRLGPGEVTHRWPEMLPGGKAVLFTAAGTEGMENATIEVADLKTGTVKVLLRGGYFGRYLPSGHLVYIHQGALYGERFDLDRLETTGTPVQLLDDVLGDPVDGRGRFDFSAAPGGAGTLIYAAGKSTTTWTLRWLDAEGKSTGLGSPPSIYFNPVFARDGRLAVNAGPGGGDIVVYSPNGESMTPLTFDGGSDRAVWAPDQKHILLRTSAAGFKLIWLRADGAGQPQVLLTTPNLVIPWSISPDGKRLAYWEDHPETHYDISFLPLDLSDPEHPKHGPPEPFLHTRANEAFPVFSPDGRWIAYRSDDSGLNEIYVRGVSGGGKWPISVGGGLYAIWAPNGHELFYETADNRIMVVDYTANGDAFLVGKRRIWYDRPLFYPGHQNLALAPDGKRFVVFQTSETAAAPTRMVFLLNFFDEVKRRIP